MTKLQELLDKVEAGESTSLYLATDAGFTWAQFELTVSAYNGSLDAAKSLHEAVLDYAWDIESFTLRGEIVLSRRNPIDRAYGYVDENPARAWLIAILKALIAQE